MLFHCSNLTGAASAEAHLRHHSALQAAPPNAAAGCVRPQRQQTIPLMEMRWPQPRAKGAIVPLMSLPVEHTAAPPTNTIGVTPSPLQRPEIHFQADFLAKIREGFLATARLSSQYEDDPLRRLEKAVRDLNNIVNLYFLA